MQVRRCAHLMIEPRERLDFDLSLLASGGTGLRNVVEWIALAPHRDEEIVLSEDEVARFQEQLSAILDAVSKVSELDLSDVPPTSHPLAIANTWADDVPRPCLSHDEVFANAPDRDGDYFRTPPA